MATIPQATAKSSAKKSKHKSARKIKQNNQQKISSTEMTTTSMQPFEEEVRGDQPLEWHDQQTTQQQLEECAKFLNKLKTLQCALEADLLACDAKWTLFVSAAFSYRYDSVLCPYPPQFATEQSGQEIDALMSVIKDTPKLCIVLQNLMEENYSEPPSEVINLLYWVLIVMEEPVLRLVEGEAVNSLLSSIDEKPIKIKPTHVFELIDLSGFHSDLKFQTRISNLPLKLAFMGQKLDTYFSILQNGFAPLTEKNNDLKLTTDLPTSLQHSPYCAAWGASQCGSIISCTAICEFALNTEEDTLVANKNDKSCVDIHLCNSQKARLRYLVFYGRRFPRNLLAPRGLLSWIYSHKFSFSIFSYLLLLLSIGVANTNTGAMFKLYVCQKFELVLDFCRRILTKEPTQ